MKKYLHIKEIKIPIYRGSLIITLTNSAKKLQKYIPDFEDRDIYAHSYLADYKGTQGYYIILNFDNKYRKIKHGTIAHEAAVHIPNFIAINRGIEPDFVNDEPIAYLAEWITDNVYKFLSKHKMIVK